MFCLCHALTGTGQKEVRHGPGLRIVLGLQTHAFREGDKPGEVYCTALSNPAVDGFQAAGMKLRVGGGRLKELRQAFVDPGRESGVVGGQYIMSQLMA